MNTKIPGLALATLLVASNSYANELLLDWDTLEWEPNGQTNLSQTFAVGSNDVTVTVGGNTGGLDNTGTLSPRIDNNQTGGLTPIENGLVITTDYPVSDPDRYVTILFDFSDYVDGVSDLSFDLFDIDLNGSFVDEVMITALVNGTVVDPTSLISGPANELVNANTVAGTSLSNSTSSDGNVSVEFAYSGITQLLITYSNGGPTSNAGLQTMSIHDIGYSAVPLPGSLLFLGSALAALGLKRRK